MRLKRNMGLLAIAICTSFCATVMLSDCSRWVRSMCDRTAMLSVGMLMPEEASRVEGMSVCVCSRRLHKIGSYACWLLVGLDD